MSEIGDGDGITFWHNIQMPMGTMPTQSPNLLSHNGGGRHGVTPPSPPVAVAFIRMETPHVPGTREAASEAQHLLTIINKVLGAQIGSQVEVLMGNALRAVSTEWPERRVIAVSNLFYVTYEPERRVVADGSMT